MQTFSKLLGARAAATGLAALGCSVLAMSSEAIAEPGEQEEPASRDAPDHLAGLPEPSGEIWVHAPGVGAEAHVELFDEDGDFDDEALAELDEVFECRRSGDSRAVHPQLLILLSHVYDHFGGERIELVSGFRNQQNEGSRHFHASAMDLRVGDASVREIAEFAEELDTDEGPNLGIGRYPRSGFVHIDIRAPGEPSYRWVQIGNRHRQLQIPDS